MESLDYWRLCEEITVVQAALLLIGKDPSGENHDVENWKVPDRPAGFEAAKTAIGYALMVGKIQGKLMPLFEYDINGNATEEIENTIDHKNSIVSIDSLKQWLSSRGIRTGFFFPTATEAPDYLFPNHPRYAPKLAAAVQAWLAVTDSKGKTPKQALEKWLREHAAEFGLSDDEGKPNETGINEVAKVANWQPGGGAPKTPS